MSCDRHVNKRQEVYCTLSDEVKVFVLQEFDQRLCVSFMTCQEPTELHHPSTTDVLGFLLKSFYSEALVNEVLYSFPGESAV